MEIRPLTGAFGAEVHGVDLGSDIGDQQAQAIQMALAENAVLVFREQDFDIDGFEKFAMNIGQFGDTPFITPVDGHPNVLLLLRESD